MARFANIGKNRTINLDQVTEIRWREDDVDGNPQVRVFFPGGGYTTLTVEEGEVLWKHLRLMEGAR